MKTIDVKKQPQTPGFFYLRPHSIVPGKNYF